MTLDEYNQTILRMADDARRKVADIETFMRENSHTQEIGGVDAKLVKHFKAIRHDLAETQFFLEINE